MKIEKTTKYNRTIQVASDKIYDEITTWLTYLSGPNQRFMDGYCFTFLDKNETKVVRGNRETKKIELSDKVDSFVEDLIKYINKREIGERSL